MATKREADERVSGGRLRGDQIRMTPYTILIDSREGHPYSFTGISGDSNKKYSPIVVKTQVECLQTGDYTLEGFADKITIERKSLSDLYSTIGQSRDRFEREFQRMAELDRAFLVIEADWHTILVHPPEHAKLHPKVVYRTLTSWSLRYNVHVLTCGAIAENIGARRWAEMRTFRLLDFYWRHHGKDGKETE